jgi:hypothetical protein
MLGSSFFLKMTEAKEIVKREARKQERAMEDIAAAYAEDE